MTELTVPVTGMTCGGCENAVQRALGQMAGVTQVTASHRDATVRVTFDPAVVEPRRPRTQDRPDRLHRRRRRRTRSAAAGSTASATAASSSSAPPKTSVAVGQIADDAIERRARQPGLGPQHPRRRVQRRVRRGARLHPGHRGRTGLPRRRRRAPQTATAPRRVRWRRRRPSTGAARACRRRTAPCASPPAWRRERRGPARSAPR